MARTKAQARKSTGGRAPRKQLAGRSEGTITYPDHSGRPVTTIYNSSSQIKDIIPKLSFHIYPLSSMTDSATHIGTRFLASDGISGWGNARNWWPRVDVYAPMASVDECMAHHVKEKEFRKRRGGPHIVPNWSNRSYEYGNPYRNVILVIPADCASWSDVEEKGLLWVQFDLIRVPGDDVEVMEWPQDGEEEESFEDCSIEKVPIGPDPSSRSLFHLWSALTSSLSDCTYRIMACDGCMELEVHADEECEIVSDMHYFNDDGECIACLNAPPLPDEEEGGEEGEEAGD
ncbi:hypothetical protein K490DRAFT_41574 [Saccharata proteae CBS 121410]|uniref:Uncharacterized protein n=1 Tax=Saccharata proteae CBS 121410 TaxID=1314787 RepID=A0A9P4LZ50_9PEZI|nr:hypothetical protein K490DRAFT_41574 [Saccharata proteae CBS 121410]